MNEIELECPKCKTLLNLDAGFAGGVCRCSNCGTLMTVPADPSSEKAEEVVGRKRRPERPRTPEAGSDQPSRPASPQGTDTADTAQPQPPAIDEEDDDTIEPVERPRSSSRSKRKGSSRSTSRATSTASPVPDMDDEEILVTKSGKRIVVSNTRTIPTARKSNKLMIRLITASVFIGILLVIIAISAGAIIMLATSDADREAKAEDYLAYQVQNFPYDRNANPLTIDKPNAMGFPMRGRTMILIDASEGADTYLPFVAEAIGTGLAKPEARGRFDIGLINGDGITRYNGAMRSLQGADANSITTFIKGGQPKGKANFTEAVNKVAEDSPIQIIAITGNPLSSVGGMDAFNQAVEALKTAVEAENQTATFGLDVLTINRDDLDWQDTAFNHGGTYSQQTMRKFDDWKNR